MERPSNVRRPSTSTLVVDPAWERALLLVGAECLELNAVVPQAGTEEVYRTW